MKIDKWFLFRISIHFLLATSFPLFLFVFKAFIKSFGYQIIDWLGITIEVILFCFILLMASFQLFNLSLMQLFRNGKDVLRKLDSWTYYLLLRINFIIVACILITTCFLILPDLLSSFRSGETDRNDMWFSGALFLFIVIFIFNLISSILYKRYLIRSVEDTNALIVEELANKIS